MDIADRLIDNVAAISFGDIPDDVVAATKLSILDTLGCMVAGADAPGCAELRGLVTDWGGAAQSTIMSTAKKAPCANAAFVNATAARALDFDSVWERGLHMSAASVPAALAVAEHKGGITGKALLAALVAGEDLAMRVHQAMPSYRGFEPSGVCGILGVAAIAGKILGLEKSTMHDALAIAMNRAAGSFQPNVEKTLTIRLLQGLAARSGIESALLAECGISGGTDTLQGPYGFFSLFAGVEVDAERILSGLGRDFPASVDNTFKYFPICGGATTAVEATVELIQEHGIRPEAIRRIEVNATPGFHSTLGMPFEPGRVPQVSAQFNYSYAVAAAVLNRGLTIKDIQPEAVTGPDVRALAQRVVTVADPDLARESSRGSKVTIFDGSNNAFSKKILYPRGSSRRPAAEREIVDKFAACMQHAGVSGHAAAEAIALVQSIEDCDDISGFVRRFAELSRAGG